MKTMRKKDLRLDETGLLQPVAVQEIGTLMVIPGDEGHNLLIGTDEDDIISGFGGNDTMEGGAGADQFDGGDGIDTVSYANSSGPVIVDLVWNSGIGGDAQGDTFVSVENLVGSSFNDRLCAGISFDPFQPLSTVLDGGDGDDILEGRSGADTFIGGDGTDTVAFDLPFTAQGITADLSAGYGVIDGIVFRLIGIENLDGYDNPDVLRGNAGNNTLRGFWGDDTLDGGDGADILNGDVDYSDTATYVGSNAAVHVNLGAHTASGGYAKGDVLIDIENLVGSIFGDQLVGDHKDNKLEGKSGNDTIAGGGGSDLMIGGKGNDDYHVARGEGKDKISLIETGLSDVDELFFGGVEHDQLWFTRTGNDLLIQVIGEDDSAVTVVGWFDPSFAGQRLDFFHASNGMDLTQDKVRILVDAMKGLAPPDAFDIPNDPIYDPVRAAIASAWQDL